MTPRAYRRVSDREGVGTFEVTYDAQGLPVSLEAATPFGTDNPALLADWWQMGEAPVTPVLQWPEDFSRLAQARRRRKRGTRTSDERLAAPLLPLRPRRQ
jgi:hypothetical protein